MRSVVSKPSQVRLRQRSGQYADRHSLLQGPIQHFKPKALKETLGGFCKDMKPLLPRTGRKLDPSSNQLQAVSTPPPNPSPHATQASRARSHPPSVQETQPAHPQHPNPSKDSPTQPHAGRQAHPKKMEHLQDAISSKTEGLLRPFHNRRQVKNRPPRYLPDNPSRAFWPNP